MATRRTRGNWRRTSNRRPTTRRVRRGGSQWTPQEIAFMRKYYRNNETAWVARQLGRTVYSVRYKASDLNIRKARPSIWRGNTGVTKSYTRKPAFRASSYRKPRKARASKSRRSNTRKTYRKRY